jgi:hypothetical protein
VYSALYLQRKPPTEAAIMLPKDQQMAMMEKPRSSVSAVTASPIYALPAAELPFRRPRRKRTAMACHMFCASPNSGDSSIVANNPKQITLRRPMRSLILPQKMPVSSWPRVNIEAMYPAY